jgi:hypothetical protein
MSRDDRAAWVKAHGLPRLERSGSARWLVAPIVQPLIERLSRGAVGWCNASAPALRIMAFVDTGYLYGERSIPRFIHRDFKRGKLRHKRAAPGWYFARSKRWTRNGTQLNRYESEAERRERLWREKTAKRKEREAKRRSSQERARLARLERHKPRQPSPVRVVRPTEPEPVPLASESAREALAGILAQLANPRPVAPLEAPAADVGPTWRERIDEAQRRAAEWAREPGEPEPGDE